MADKKEAKKPIYKMWQFWVGVAGVIIMGPFVLSAIISGFIEGLNNSDSLGATELSAQTSNINQEDSEIKPEEQKFTDSDAEIYCQDAYLIEKFLDLSKIKILTITGTPTQKGDFGGWYDSDGNDVKYVRWSGEYKATGEEIRFDCWVSGKDKNNVKLHRFEVAGVRFIDTVKDTVFDSSGNLILEY